MESHQTVEGGGSESGGATGGEFWTIVERLRDIAANRVVFGEPVRGDGVLVIPAAAVRGGGGGGSGSAPDGSGSGGGGGLGFEARPVGAFVVRGDRVTWCPAVDVVRLAVGFQVVALVGVLAVGRARRRARRSRRR